MLDKCYENITIICMSNTILQVPLSESLRSDAVSVAKENGFSSLQEVVRLFLTKFARREVGVSIERFPAVNLSAKNAKRYDKMVKDFESKRNVKVFKNTKDLMKDLSS